MSEGVQVKARGRDKPTSSSWLLLEAGEWTAQGAAELLGRFEAGELSAERSVKAGELSEPKPLYRVMRELVWDAQAEASEPSARSQYFELVDHAPIPTAMSDLGGRITYVNRAFCDFIGYESEELIGMTVGALSHPDDHKSEVVRGNRLMSKGRGGFKMEKRYLTSSGELKVGLLSISMLHSEEGQPYAVLAQVSDLTERQRLERDLSRAQTLSALGEMAQRVTHDLKNIMMILRGSLDLLESQTEGLKMEDQELIQDGLMACQSGEALVKSLLDFKLDEQPKLSALALTPLLKQLSQTLKRGVAPAQFKLELDEELEGRHLNSQAVSIERMLLNLCINARQALEATGRPLSEEQITVRARPLSEAELTQYEADRELFALEVHDRGVGIPPELIDRIIEPYVSTRHGQGGHGIGLSTVWSLCDQLGGTLKIESERGLGTSMIMILPLLEESAALSEALSETLSEAVSEAVPNPVNETERVDADRGREP